MTRPSDTQAAPETGRLSFSDLSGWMSDDHAAALMAYAQGQDADEAAQARQFFEDRFRLGTPIPAHVTGYYEPEIDGALVASDAFPTPIHGLPQDPCHLTRAEIDAGIDAPVLAWVRDPVDRFFLQVQGSGQIRLAGGDTLRLGYAGKTVHPYRSIGKILIERGVFGADITADALKDWLRADPDRGRSVMAENPSYVFFRALPGHKGGPLGTLGVPVTAGRSVAVDPDHLPLGTPVWLEVGDIARLCVAQDTGSAIKGAGRIDLFHGTGEAAGRAAGQMNHTGRIIPLVAR